MRRYEVGKVCRYTLDAAYITDHLENWSGTYVLYLTYCSSSTLCGGYVGSRDQV